MARTHHWERGETQGAMRVVRCDRVLPVLRGAVHRMRQGHSERKGDMAGETEVPAVAEPAIDYAFQRWVERTYARQRRPLRFQAETLSAWQSWQVQLRAKVLELSGPESYSPEQVAAALSQLFKRPVTAQPAPLSDVVPTFKAFGFSDEAAALFEDLYRAFANGSIVYESPESVVRGVVTLSQALSKMAA